MGILLSFYQVWKSVKSNTIYGLGTGIFKPVFCFQFSIRSAITEKSEFNFGVACLLISVFTSQQLQSAEKSSNPGFYIGSNPRKILGFKPRISNPKTACISGLI